ncbi:MULTISPECIES: ArsR/SmtB family transcription factor [Enterococcus]|uniref:Metalloregulator ArsR/SmtB family transcription factor n=1 Tax=Enterococcus alishanensis TaxID=1303817 RepID=A0ABS6T8F3_9ENTE|nr:metalloregulator ArsR/SmtB family transcription factor [Enterococcus alishanensis]MBV7389167.1 metalloregulator ArsR/SmtB family transcription factor [Enterococcus alishanensis]
MKEHEEILTVSRFYKVLSDPTRLKILMFLKDGERNVSSISEKLAMEQSAVSHQLKLLRDNRLVKARRDGKAMLYSLDDHHVLDILDQTFQHILHQ